MPAFGAGSQSAQNRAHREDANWARLKGGIYLGSNGWTIVKDDRTGLWNVYDETGAHAQDLFSKDGKRSYRISHSSLTWAKYGAADELEKRAQATAA